MRLNEPEELLNRKKLAVATITTSIFCMLLTLAVLSTAPRVKNLHLALEVLIMHGWVTGLYLSFSAVTIRPLCHRFLSRRLNKYIDIAHGLQLPFVVVGVGTWAILKLLGKF